jgi:predicted lipoprotein with Yx(FWY)xxD motif
MTSTLSNRARLLLVLAAVVGLTVAVYAVRTNMASAAHRQLVVKTMKNRALGKTILVNRRDLTLYSLSAEKRGRFICTNAVCLSLWKPLVVARGTTPTGTSSLGTVRRPDGRTQVSYRGLPLYTFTEDHKPGDVKGNGFKDVGIWRPASASRTGSAPAAPMPAGGGYGY